MIDVENAVGLEVSRIGPVTLSLFTAGTVLSGQNSAVDVNPLQQPSALSDAYQPTHGLRTAQQTWMKEPRQGPHEKEEILCCTQGVLLINDRQLSTLRQQAWSCWR